MWISASLGQESAGSLWLPPVSSHPRQELPQLQGFNLREGVPQVLKPDLRRLLSTRGNFHLQVHPSCWGTGTSASAEGASKRVLPSVPADWACQGNSSAGDSSVERWIPSCACTRHLHLGHGSKRSPPGPNMPIILPCPRSGPNVQVRSGGTPLESAPLCLNPL